MTSGEPAGIGPEICSLLAKESLPARIVVVGDRGILPGCPNVEHVPLERPRVPGKLDPANSRYVLRLIDRAVQGCLAGEFGAMVTAPVQKSVINDAGIAFTGHTEYLAERARAEHVVMMLVGGGLRVALATTHLPLAAVPASISKKNLLLTLRVLDRDLKQRFKIKTPRILVAGLNPHSGEAGHLGTEDAEVIAPAVQEAVSQGIAASGPKKTVSVPHHPLWKRMRVFGFRVQMMTASVRWTAATTMNTIKPTIAPTTSKTSPASIANIIGETSSTGCGAV